MMGNSKPHGERSDGMEWRGGAKHTANGRKCGALSDDHGIERPRVCRMISCRSMPVEGHGDVRS